jgi:hypothetical protein
MGRGPKPFDRLTALSKVEGSFDRLTTQSEVEGSQEYYYISRTSNRSPWVSSAGSRNFTMVSKTRKPL